jgi:hypothetical protein
MSTTLKEEKHKEKRKKEKKNIQSNIKVLMIRSKEKVKQSRNSPGVTQRVPGGLGSQIT